MQTTDVVIVGGGVIGSAIAYFLRKGGVAVTLLERGEIGGQASGAAAGLLAPLGPLSGPGSFADLVLAGFSRLYALIPELEESSGIHMGYEQTGALRIVRNEKRAVHLRKRLHNWQPLGLQLSWLNGEEACLREPLLSSETFAAVYAPGEAQIEATRVVQAFAYAAQRDGAKIYERQEVDQFLREKATVRGVVTTQGETIGCQQLVLASGAWVAECAARLNVALPIRPLHGQIIALPQTRPPLSHIIFGEAVYLIPRSNMILVGATKEERGFDPAIAASGTHRLYETAVRLVPALKGCEVQTAWAGLRPKTPDSQPLLGLLAPWENVLVAAGHNSVGIILSAITGECMAEMVITGRAPALIQPFAVERFSTNESPTAI